MGYLCDFKPVTLFLLRTILRVSVFDKLTCIAANGVRFNKNAMEAPDLVPIFTIIAFTLFIRLTALVKIKQHFVKMSLEFTCASALRCRSTFLIYSVSSFHIS